MLESGGAAFLALHGLVHSMYVAVSHGWVESQDAVGWNGQSWLLSAHVPEGSILTAGSVLYVLVTLGFLLGAVGVYSQRHWTNQILGASAILSTIVLFSLWDGSLDRLVDKGVLGLVINTGILGYIFIVD